MKTWFSADGPSFLEDRASALPACPLSPDEVIGTSADLITPSYEARAPNTLCSSVPRDLVVSLICHRPWQCQSSRPSSDFPVTSLQTPPTSVTTQILWPFTTSTLMYILLSQVDCELLDGGKWVSWVTFQTLVCVPITWLSVILKFGSESAPWKLCCCHGLTKSSSKHRGQDSMDMQQPRAW